MRLSIVPSRRRVALYCFLALLFFLMKIPSFLLFDLREISGDRFREDVLARRAYLVDQVFERKLSVSDMPWNIGTRFRGEWLLGTHSMFVSALTNVAFLYPETRAESLPMIVRSIEQLLEPETRAFDTEGWGEDALTDIRNRRGHIAYFGHLAWMLGAYKLLGGDNRFDDLYHAVIGSLRQSIREGHHHCGETYPNETYIMDNAVVVAALKNYDRVFMIGSDPEVDAWVAAARGALLDRETGLLLFSLAPDGSPLVGSRGSGAGWNSFYLPFIDTALAEQQFSRLKTGWQDTALGVFGGIREYPRGRFGIGDVDSGPVIFGLSPSGTGFSIAGARRGKDTALFGSLLFTAEAAGTTVEFNGKRRYLFAPLVGDAIVLAMKTATDWQPAVFPAS